jgi:hypothetical protein
VKWAFTVEDQAFLAGYEPTDSLQLSATVNNNQVLLYGAPAGGGQLLTGGNYFNYRPASFSGIDVTSGTNLTSTSACVEPPPNSPPPPVGQGSLGSVAPGAKYAGPEFSGLSSKPVTVGASSVLEGKRLNEVSSITIGGKSATFTATATELKLDVPKDLAPGLYDLVIHSAAGKLTQINAVRVQGPRTSLSVTTISEGRISSEQLHEHALIAAMQQPELNKARCIVNGPNLAQAKAQAERLCALVKASNKNIETTVVESRSTVKNNKVYARVSYGWN